MKKVLSLVALLSCASCAPDLFAGGCWCKNGSIQYATKDTECTTKCAPYGGMDISVSGAFQCNNALKPAPRMPLRACPCQDGTLQAPVVTNPDGTVVFTSVNSQNDCDSLCKNHSGTKASWTDCLTGQGTPAYWFCHCNNGCSVAAGGPGNDCCKLCDPYGGHSRSSGAGYTKLCTAK